MEDTRHLNLTDPATETVYCHYQGDVVKFDGVHVAKVCWNCPYWGGLAEGYGVECVYDDPNATAPEVKYTKPNAAKAEAPQKPAEGEEDSVASAAGIAARDARAQLAPAKPEQEVPAEDAGKGAEQPPAEEGAAAAAPAPGAAGAEEEMPTEPAATTAPATPPAKAPAAPAPKAPPAAPTAPAAPGAKAPVPPVPPKKKKPFPPVPAGKSATAVDVLAAIAQEKKS